MKQFTRIEVENGEREIFSPHPESKCLSIFIQDACRTEGWNIEIPYAHIERWRHELKLCQIEIEAHLTATRAAADAREAATDAT